MDKCRLSTPLNHSVLNEIAFALKKYDKPFRKETVAWLGGHRAEEQMAAEVRELWRQSSLPLRTWAERINHVELWMKEEDVRLAVHLVDDRDTFAWQAVPLQPADLKRCVANYPHPLPEMVLRLACVAPGLSIRENGTLAEPACFARRLGYVQSWVSGEDRRRIESLGFALPDAEKHLIEIASNGIGDCYILGTNEEIYFFDHEAGGIVSCTLRLDELIDSYFAEPSSIIDPYHRGWAVEPEEDGESEVGDEHLTHVLLRRKKELTNLGAIGVSVRACLRAMPGQWIPPLSGYWQEFEEAIVPILRQIQRAVVTGHACEEGWATECLGVLKECESKYAPSAVPEGCGYMGVLLVSDAIPSLIESSKCLHDLETAQDSVSSCSCSLVIIGRQHVLMRMQQAAIADIDHLSFAGLGIPGEVGKPVPPEFFDRPLWPDGDPP